MTMDDLHNPHIHDYILGNIIPQLGTFFVPGGCGTRRKHTPTALLMPTKVTTGEEHKGYFVI